MNVFVVIAVFNRIEHTLHCLSLLAKQRFSNFSTVVVDDGSTDGTAAQLTKLYPEVIQVKGSGDWWWAKSMNKGFERALLEGADVVITLNNDVVFDEWLIADLVKLHQRHPKNILGCLNTTMDGRIFFAGIRKISWWKAKEYKYYKAFSQPEQPMKGVRPTQCLNGRGTLIPAEALRKTKGFDDAHFPQYASDYDFTLRAVRFAYPSLICWDIRIQSVIEETGKGRSFICQSWGDFLRSFNDPHASSSLRMLWHYYKRHAGWQAISGLPLQLLRSMVSFYRKRNILEEEK
ncbi:MULTISPECIES: glycosyltransferase family 2 protein [unclassified Carboxylicivirga]|uniref:glycosyltransferase family 2 protein n=1 Tax=Carboxylicivirga TaxID=1628153 RepID=UPI003D338E3F